MIGSVCLSVVSVYFYDKLPILSRVKGKWSKFFIKTLMFSVPYATVYIVTDEMKNKYLWE